MQIAPRRPVINGGSFSVLEGRIITIPRNIIKSILSLPVHSKLTTGTNEKTKNKKLLKYNNYSVSNDNSYKFEDTTGNEISNEITGNIHGKNYKESETDLERFQIVKSPQEGKLIIGKNLQDSAEYISRHQLLQNKLKVS